MTIDDTKCSAAATSHKLPKKIQLNEKSKTRAEKETRKTQAALKKNNFTT